MPASGLGKRSGARVTVESKAEGGSGPQIETPEVSKVEQLLHEYLPGTPVKVGFESAGGNLLSGRFRNAGRMRAGDAIFERIPGYGTYDCTAGFGAKERTGTVRGQATWAVFTLTAGHCRQFLTAPAFYRSTEPVPSPTNDGTWSSIGLLRRDGLEASTFVKADAGVIETTASGLVPQGIFGEGGNLVPTKSAVTAKIGETLCFSGAATRQPSCGKVVARSVNWVNEPGSFGRGGIG